MCMIRVGERMSKPIALAAAAVDTDATPRHRC
jgi:hypothetical protein